MSEATAAVLDNGKTDLTSWDKTLSDFKTRYSGISTTEKEQYESRRLAVKEMREVRGKIDKRRLELGRPLLKAKKDIDDKANWLMEEIWKLEEPLKIANDAIDEEVARLKRIAEQDERDKAQAAEKAAFEAHAERQRKEAEAERARLKAEADKLAAERSKAEAEAKVERERLAAEKSKLDAEAKVAHEEAHRIQAENTKQREALAAEQRKFQEQREAVAEAERKRLQAIDAERMAKEAVELAEAKRVAKEAARVERERIEAARREAMRPDVEKVRGFADVVDAIIEQSPNVSSDEAVMAIMDALTEMAELAMKLRSFGD